MATPVGLSQSSVGSIGVEVLAEHITHAMQRAASNKVAGLDIQRFGGRLEWFMETREAQQHIGNVQTGPIGTGD